MLKTKIIGATAAIAVIAIVAFFAMTSGTTGSSVEQAAVVEPAAGANEAQEEQAVVTAPEEEIVIAEAPAGEETMSGGDVVIDAKKALEDRVLGDENAPIVVEEYAALSCSHCAHFYKETFPELKEKYIDTGKVKFIYRDFPFNAQAMDGAMIARCLPHDKYFKFIKFLFNTQNDWAFGGSHQKSLKQSAKLLGADEGMLEACLGNEELKVGLIEIMQAAGKDHGIQSTPTFVVNGEEIIRGAQKIDAFDKVFEKLLEKDNQAE